MLSAARRAQLGLAGVALVLISSLGVLGSRAIDQSEPPDAAPDFLPHDTNGRPVSLESIRGKVVLLRFSSVRCPASILDVSYNWRSSTRATKTSRCFQ